MLKKSDNMHLKQHKHFDTEKMKVHLEHEFEIL